MNESAIAPLSQDKHENLWHHAPGWRTLTVSASLLTLVAVALPVLLPQQDASPLNPVHPALGHAPLAVIATPPSNPSSSSSVPGLSAPNPQASAAPVLAKVSPKSNPSMAAQNLAARAPTQLSLASTPRATSQFTTAQTPTSQPSAQVSQVSTPQASPQATTQSAAPVCNMTRQDIAPHLTGLGTIIGFEDHALSLARIQVTETNVKGMIDPDYIENQRVIVQNGSGQTGVFILPKGMSVQIGDRVTVQSAYRNTALPCNYIPVMIASDIGPPPKPASAPQ